MTHKERLTIKYDGLPVPKELCTIDRLGDADDCDSCEEVCSRLFGDCTDNCPIQKCFNRLAELEDKIENGTLIELSCKIGDTVWFIKDKDSFFSEPKSEVISNISIWDNETIFYTKNRMFFNEKYFRQNAFFTYEEAEQALKKEKKE